MAIKKININGKEHELIASKLGSSSAGSGGAVWHLSNGAPIEDPESYGSYDTPIFIKKGTYTPVSSIDSDLLPDATSSTKGAVIVDESVSETSANPVQNSVITAALANKANASALTNHTINENNPHNVTAAQTGALPTTGGTMTGILYTSASTPLLIGTNGKVGMRAKTNDVNNVGQINVSNAWWSTGNQWGTQMSGYNGETGKYNQLRVSHEGVQYIGEDDVAHQVLHDGNVGTAATYNATTSIAPGGTGLPTAAAVYTYVNETILNGSW